jgi:hypothetical protein
VSWEVNPESCDEIEERRRGAAKGAWPWRIRCCTAWWLGELVLPPEEEPADEIEQIEDLREPREEGDEGGE